MKTCSINCHRFWIEGVLGRIGPLAIEPLIQYLEDDTKGFWSRTAAENGLVHIAEMHPESRLDCIKAITYGLEQYVKNDETLNGFLVSDLMDLRAIESLDVIRKAFQADAVDISIGGDLEDVEIELGVRQTRSTPKPHYHLCGAHCHVDHDEEEEWLSTLPQLPRTPKIGRNDPCHCGSGKKYKKCCLT